MKGWGIKEIFSQKAREAQERLEGLKEEAAPRSPLSPNEIVKNAVSRLDAETAGTSEAQSVTYKLRDELYNAIKNDPAEYQGEILPMLNHLIAEATNERIPPAELLVQWLTDSYKEPFDKDGLVNDDVSPLYEMRLRFNSKDRPPIQEIQEEDEPYYSSGEETSPFPQSEEEFLASLENNPAFQEFERMSAEFHPDDEVPPPFFDSEFVAPEMPAPAMSAPPPPVPPHNNPVYGTARQQEPPKEKPKAPPKKPSGKSKGDDDIIITSDMLTSPVRQTYEIKPEYQEDIVHKLFSRLNLPKIEYELKNSNVRIEAGGNLPAEVILESKDGKETKVPLKENEQNSLETAVDEYEAKKAKELD